MKNKKRDIIMQNKVFLWIALGVGALLLIPFFAMRFSSDVNWTLSDFIIAGALLFSIGSLFVLAARKVKSASNRIIVGLFFLALLFYLWSELAVGIFTNWGS